MIIVEGRSSKSKYIIDNYLNESDLVIYSDKLKFPQVSDNILLLGYEMFDTNEILFRAIVEEYIVKSDGTGNIIFYNCLDVETVSAFQYYYLIKNGFENEVIVTIQTHRDGILEHRVTNDTLKTLFDTGLYNHNKQEELI